MTKASLQSARNRLKSFPKLLASCSKEGAVYGQCVSRKHEDVSLDACLKEFQMFRDCIRNAAKDMKIRV